MLSATDDVNHRAHRSHVELGMSETLSFQKCQRCHSALPCGRGGEPCTPPQQLSTRSVCFMRQNKCLGRGKKHRWPAGMATRDLPALTGR